MSEQSRTGQRSFKTNIETILDELSLAFQWDRPSLLITVHRSRAGLLKASEALEQGLRKFDRSIIRVDFGDEQTGMSLLFTPPPDAASSVFFVSGLDRREGNAAYTALNLHREFFVENKFKLVFWLTENEAASLPRLAPDFWAFRHRVLEFSSRAARLPPAQWVRLLLWHDGELASMPAELARSILSQEKLLAGLPRTQDSLAIRVEQHYLLGHSYWAAGEPGKALQALVAGVRLADHPAFTAMKTWLLNGAAIIAHENGKHAEALKVYQTALALNREDPVLLMNAGITLCSLGRNRDGMDSAAKAAALAPADAAVWNRMGHLHVVMGKYDEALSCFEKAAGLVSSESRYHESLAACYSLMGFTDEALNAMTAAARAGTEDSARLSAYTQAILGHPEQAVELLSSGIAAGQISRPALDHDPNLPLILDPSLISRIA
ncbi:MAG: hypothetical protein ACM3QS_11955 [Bacteroidota bacterium]